MFSSERYIAAVEGAVVLERHPRGRIMLTGADRLAYLQGLLTNDVARLTAGTGCYAALLTPQGRMISDMRVLELGDAVLLDVPGELTARVASHLADFIFSEDATVQDASGTLAHSVILGRGAARTLDLDPPGPFESRRVAFAGMEVTVSGNDDFGVPAIDLFVESSRQPAILAALAAAGVTATDDDVAEILRIEAGTPRFGIDMDQDTIPLEAGIEDRAISLTKGCYVGQEVIIRVLHRGQGRVARRLVGLVFSPDARVPTRGDRLHAADRHIGGITSAVWSPALRRPVALGYVHRDFTGPGTTVDAGEDARQRAVVTTTPFVRR
jgi:folate-binding protein YgfZ